jgi:hypothetical protein
MQPEGPLTYSPESATGHCNEPLDSSPYLISLGMVSLILQNVRFCVTLKPKLSHYTPRRHFGERRYSSQSFTISALDGSEWSASRPGERTPGTHCTGGWVGPRAGADTEVGGKILCLCWGSNPDRPIVQPVARHCTYWATPAHFVLCYRQIIRKKFLYDRGSHVTEDIDNGLTGFNTL